MPTQIYIYYLKNKYSYHKITEFLELSKTYMHAQVKRIQNRLKNDIPRYDPDYLSTSLKKGRELFEEEFLLYAEKNKEKLKESLLTNPDYPNRVVLLKIINMTDAEKEEYKKTPEFTQSLDIAYKQKELKSTRIETKLPKTEKSARRLSFRKSIDCSMLMLRIAQLFDIHKSKFSFSSHGGTYLVNNLAKEIINLYTDNTYYYYTDTIFLDNYYNHTHNALINMLNNPQLIGINIEINFTTGSPHAISAYTCNNNQILYDDNLSKPIQVNWKDSLIRILTEIKKSNEIIKIQYFEHEEVISNLDFEEIIEENLQYILKEQIDNIHKEWVIHTKAPTTREKIESEYIQARLGYMYNISPCIKNITSKTEEEHLLNNIFTKFSLSPDDLDIAIDRLLNIKRIKKINLQDRNAILNLIIYILDKNTNINLYVIYYLFELFKKNQSSDINNIIIQTLNKYPQIINNFDKYYTIINDITIYIYILFLNTPESEIFLENLEDEYKQYILQYIGDYEHDYYVWNGKEFIEKSLGDIVKEIKLKNITKSPFKQQIIDILSNPI